LKDQRIDKKPFTLLRGIGQYDAQWYLKIATSGYPNYPKAQPLIDKVSMGDLSYAFFPLYPLLIHIINLVISNIELSAFILTNILLLIIFFSLYFVISSVYNTHAAFKTIFLLFLFPFSIFFRSYFTEGLLLLEILWFSYFLIKKNWLASGLLLGASLVTRGTGLFLLPVFITILGKQVYAKKLSIKKSGFYLLLSLMPFFLWILYCYIHTGNGLYFYEVRKAWTTIPIHLMLLHNIVFVFFSSLLPIHGFHYSQLDNFFIIIAALLLILSWKKIYFELWFISFMLWLGPLLTTDTMSFTRYQTISFPLFLYLALLIKNKVKYSIILAFLGCGLFIVSLYFVNWYWIG
jgi:hypothetical protein